MRGAKAPRYLSRNGASIMRVASAFGRFIRDGFAFIGLVIFVGALIAAAQGVAGNPPRLPAAGEGDSQATRVAAPLPLPRSARPIEQPCFAVACPSLLLP